MPHCPSTIRSNQLPSRLLPGIRPDIIADDLEKVIQLFMKNSSRSSTNIREFSQMSACIYDLNANEIGDLLKSWGEPDYRASQLWSGLYQQIWTSPDDFSACPNPFVKNFPICMLPENPVDGRLSFTRLKPVQKLIQRTVKRSKPFLHLAMAGRSKQC